MKLHLGNCLDVLKTLADNSIDSIVTDPPYGLSFMGKKWDYDVPSTEIWIEALRVLKPGGHLLSFFGTRTYHRGVVRIEDAGFEIRDQIMWIYGSGFPKSTDISKRIDKEAGAEREVVGIVPHTTGIQRNNSLERDELKGGNSRQGKLANDMMKITVPKTDLAKQWQGWGSALKPANEPIVVARKPLEKGLTLAENVIKWGCGAINVDACRIELSENEPDSRTTNASRMSCNNESWILANKADKAIEVYNKQGRWPANILFDEQAAMMLDKQTQGLHGAGFKRDAEIRPTSQNIEFKGALGTNMQRFGDSGGASRFFYVAKASKSERNKGLEGMPEKKNDFQRETSVLSKSGDELGKTTGNQNFHPTVKPIKLMEYLCKLITPPQGTVLDPFMGSGSTGVAAKNLGFDFIGIEMNEEYLAIALKRIDNDGR